MTSGRRSDDGIHRRLFRLWLPVLLLCCMAAPVRAANDQPGFTIRGVDVTLNGGVYYLAAHIEYRLSDEAIRALDNGVALTVELQVEVAEPRLWGFWNQDIAWLSQRYRLRYHALSGRYVLSNLNSGVNRSFGRRESALAAMGVVKRLPVIDRHLLANGKTYELRLRARLDTDALPRPLRAIAYMSPDWRLTSGWFTWPLQN